LDLCDTDDHARSHQSSIPGDSAVLEMQPSENSLAVSERLRRVSTPETNPFINNTPPMCCNSITKAIFIGVFLLPLRLVLFGPSIAMAWILCAIATTCIPKPPKIVRDEEAGGDEEAVCRPTRAEDDVPLAPWRQKLVEYTAFWWRLWLYSLSYHTFQVVGTPAPREEARICVGNHTSFLDIFAMYACKRFMFVAKAEVRRIPFGWQIIRAGQTLLVDRCDKKSAASARVAIEKRVRCDHKWPTMVMFPEGTCTNGTALITFKSGAFNPGVAVQPVTISYGWDSVDPCKVYGGGPGVCAIIWRLFTSLGNTITVTFLDVYHPSEAEQREPHLFAENVRNVMAKHLGVAVTNHSYGEVQLLLRARKLHVKGRVFPKLNLEMTNLQKILNADCSVDDFKYFLQRFHEVSGSDGLLDRDEFLQLMEMPENIITRGIFDIFDVDHTGSLDFKEFMSGVILLYYSNDPEVGFRLINSTMDRVGQVHLGEELPIMPVSRMSSFAFSRNNTFSKPIFWTPEELKKFIEDNPNLFSWMRNPRIDVVPAPSDIPDTVVVTEVDEGAKDGKRKSKSKKDKGKNRKRSKKDDR